MTNNASPVESFERSIVSNAQKSMTYAKACIKNDRVFSLPARRPRAKVADRWTTRASCSGAQNWPPPTRWQVLAAESDYASQICLAVSHDLGANDFATISRVERTAATDAGRVHVAHHTIGQLQSQHCHLD